MLCALFGRLARGGMRLPRFTGKTLLSIARGFPTIGAYGDCIKYDDKALIACKLKVFMTEPLEASARLHVIPTR